MNEPFCLSDLSEGVDIDAVHRRQRPATALERGYAELAARVDSARERCAAFATEFEQLLTPAQRAERREFERLYRAGALRCPTEALHD